MTFTITAETIPRNRLTGFKRRLAFGSLGDLSFELQVAEPPACFYVEISEGKKFTRFKILVEPFLRNFIAAYWKHSAAEKHAEN